MNFVKGDHVKLIGVGSIGTVVDVCGDICAVEWKYGGKVYYYDRVFLEKVRDNSMRSSRFKVGDRVQHKYTKESGTIVDSVGFSYCVAVDKPVAGDKYLWFTESLLYLWFEEGSLSPYNPSHKKPHKFWIVWCPGKGQSIVSHPTREEAEKEAEQLAEKEAVKIREKGAKRDTFYVMEVVSKFQGIANVDIDRTDYD